MPQSVWPRERLTSPRNASRNLASAASDTSSTSRLRGAGGPAASDFAGVADAGTGGRLGADDAGGGAEDVPAGGRAIGRAGAVGVDLGAKAGAGSPPSGPPPGCP